MDATLLAIFSGLFGLFCIGREGIAIFRAKRIQISNLFLIMYGLTYGILLSLFLILHILNKYEATGLFLRFDYSPEGLTYTAYWFFAALIGYLFFRFGSILRIGQTKRQSVSISKEDEPLENRLQITSLICLLIGIVCFVIWVNGWGGYVTLFINAEAIRNGSYGIRNPVAFFAKPAQIVSTVSVISIYLIKQKKNIKLNRFIFIISFVLSLLYYLAKDGRMTMAMYLLIVLFMMVGAFEKQLYIRKKIFFFIVAFALFVVIVLNMNSLTYFLRNKSELIIQEKTIWDSIFDELSYIYVTGQTAPKYCVDNGSPLLILHDIGLGLFAWVPSSLTPKSLIDVWHYNTYLIAGNRAMAQYPSDLISTSLYDLGVLGPILLPAFWGYIISKLDRVFKQNNTPIYTIVYYSISMTLLRLVNYSMFSSTIAATFHLFVAVVVYKAVGRISFRR